MFIRCVSYRLKILLGNKSLVFWTFAFPIILGFLFNVAFTGLDNEDTFETTKVGIVAVDTIKSDEFEAILSSVKSGKKSVYKGTNLTKKDAIQQLSEDKISGYYEVASDDVTLFVNQDGIPQTILKEFLNQYIQQVDKYVAFGQTDSKDVIERSTRQNFITEKGTSNQISAKSFYFFTLIGMSIMYGFMWGLRNASDQQANQSAKGIRLCTIPENKLKIALYNLVASLLLLVIVNSATILIFHFLYKVNFGDRWNFILLVVVLGSLLALTFGTLLGNFLTNISIDKKMSIGIGISMIMSFFAGMMGMPSIKYWIDLHLPLLGRLNIVNLISDCLYQLFYYQSLTAFYQSLIWMIGLIVLFTLLNYQFERKVQYEHL